MKSIVEFAIILGGSVAEIDLARLFGSFGNSFVPVANGWEGAMIDAGVVSTTRSLGIIVGNDGDAISMDWSATKFAAMGLAAATSCAEGPSSVTSDLRTEAISILTVADSMGVGNVDLGSVQATIGGILIVGAEKSELTITFEGLLALVVSNRGVSKPEIAGADFTD